ncbi:GNAT family N-acetyltransferase [Pedobacter sp. GR22-10]|uniref:GNAT family N-acetyltransferase n=1 Tax=Pedobacter sp. GR22-10 TaxID=2994472 RepID=UPI002246A087|nr:GNAT family N-acetyltransferase [Pedobacter sp. GR22-10]MCX2429615.1 GNAT family N-acetyltransferase [Pedobacter sp. GR22-10]
MAIKIELLQKLHKKDKFDSETPLLDNYITKQASQDVRRNLSACYVLADDDNKVVGFYTLSSSSIPREDMPSELILKLPESYRDLPTILLGRLAVDKAAKGKGYGANLLMDALENCLGLSDQLGSLAVVVDPIDEIVSLFYEKYGFIRLPDTSKMFIAMDTIRKL